MINMIYVAIDVEQLKSIAKTKDFEQDLHCYHDISQYRPTTRTCHMSTNSRDVERVNMLIYFSCENRSIKQTKEKGKALFISLVFRYSCRVLMTTRNEQQTEEVLIDMSLYVKRRTQQ
jgi:hypothetical protein